MGKNNKPHHKKKDRKHKRERSKKEHYLRKNKEEEQKKSKETEETRYILDESSHNKLIKVLRDLLHYNQETLQAVPQVFEMLDKDQEVEITDIEDGVLRESLEKIFLILEKQIVKLEDSDGRFSYSKCGKKSLKEQILIFFEKAKSAPNLDHFSDLLKVRLDSEMKLVEKPKEKAITVSKKDEQTIRAEIGKFEEEFRPKSLMQIHQEKVKNNKGGIGKAMFGNKPLSKRFDQGKFLS